jgi:hypothetical protein
MLKPKIWYHKFPNEGDIFTCISLIDEDRSFHSTEEQFKKACENLDSCWDKLKNLGFYQYFDSIAFLIYKGKLDRSYVFSLLSKWGIIYEEEKEIE